MVIGSIPGHGGRTPHLNITHASLSRRALILLLVLSLLQVYTDEPDVDGQDIRLSVSSTLSRILAGLQPKIHFASTGGHR